MKPGPSHCSRSPTARRLAALAIGMLCAGPITAHAAITNTAKAIGSYGSQPVQSPTATATVPVVTPKPTMKVVKTASPTSNLKAGDVVTYTYVVTNTGNVTLHNISLADTHNASGTAPVPAGETLTTALPGSTSFDSTPNNGVWTSLSPGDSVTFTATYTVTQHDQDTLQ